MTRGLGPCGACLMLLSYTGLARAVVPTPASTSAPVASASPAPAADGSSCREQIPNGKQRPKTTERFPARLLAGHAGYLVVDIEHGVAETVLPSGAELIPTSDEAAPIEAAGFALPEPKGPARPSVERRVEGSVAKTRVSVPFLVLPKTEKPEQLTLPPIPITLTRANGEPIQICTRPHQVWVEDPTSSTPNAQPKPNPSARRQLEEWTQLKQGVFMGLGALLLGALLAGLFLWWRRRPKKAHPLPPPLPPWDLAYQELLGIRGDRLIEQNRTAEHQSRVSDVVRKYLGAIYDYDGLESTTEETLEALRRSGVPYTQFSEIAAFLREADLVKFAHQTPVAEQCEQAMDQAERIVRSSQAALAPQKPPSSSFNQAPPGEAAR